MGLSTRSPDCGLFSLHWVTVCANIWEGLIVSDFRYVWLFYCESHFSQMEFALVCSMLFRLAHLRLFPAKVCFHATLTALTISSSSTWANGCFPHAMHIVHIKPSRQFQVTFSTRDLFHYDKKRYSTIYTTKTDESSYPISTSSSVKDGWFMRHEFHQNIKLCVSICQKYWPLLK